MATRGFMLERDPTAFLFRPCFSGTSNVTHAGEKKGGEWIFLVFSKNEAFCLYDGEGIYGGGVFCACHVSVKNALKPPCSRHKNGVGIIVFDDSCETPRCLFFIL